MAGKKTISNTTPAIGAIKIQQSTYGVVIPIVWGRTRVSGNLIWYGDFKAVPHTTTTQSGGKGGGGGVQQQSTTYTYTASVAMALCEGPVLGVRTAWRGKNIFEGSAYAGAPARAIQVASYPSPGTTVTVSNATGWANLSVEMQVMTGYADDFAYNRTGTWVTLIQGKDYTCANGVYTFGNSAYVGANLRINYTYRSSASGTSCLSQIGLDLMAGTPGQQPWSYLSSSHPDQALGYSGVAYVVGSNYGLDSGASVENHAFEIETSFMLSGSVPDADPSLILADALTNPQYGAQFGREKLALLSDYSNACLAQGIVMSPALTEQQTAASFLEQMAALTNVGLVWSGGLLKFVPYADTPITGNGVTFTPLTVPIYDLTDDDFQDVDDEGPVKVIRGAVSDSYNSVKLEYFDRANDYNIAIMEQADQADIQENGARPMPVVTAHWITDSNVAKVVATLILQRSLFIRNTYEFKLGWTKIALEPMDLVTLTDPNLGLNKQPVRILTVEESEDGYLDVTAEDFPKGSASATLYPTGSSGNGYTPNFNEDPGGVMAPMIFEGPAALSSQNSGLEVWLATGGAAATYGGCEVWVSVSGSNYQRAAVLNGSSRFGVTTSVMPTADSGTVTTDSLGVRLFAGGQLLSGTVDDMNALTTLCYVDGEYFAYRDSTLTGASAYTLGGQMVRGAYLSRSFNPHALGLPFIRCDAAIAKMPLTADYIGKTLHIKLLPFNRFGGGVGSLANATEYTYTVSGWQANLPPIAPLNLGIEGPFTAATVKFKWDRIGNAASYNVQIWANGVKVREVNAGNALRFDYSAADAKSDGGPWRSITIKVQGINANGAAGAFSSYTATNAQVGALLNPKVASNSSAVQFACDRPTDSDFSGIQVWISATPGFTPSASTLVFDGPNTSVTINRLHDNSQLTLGATYYVRAAGYDSYGTDGLTLTAEIPVVIANTTGVQTAIVYLYQWALSAPSVPTGTSAYTWSSGANANYIPAANASPPDVWALTAGSNPGTPLMRLYVATQPITASVGTATSTVSYATATVSAWSQNGANGVSGVQAGAAIVYQWAATIPAGPVGAATFTWSGPNAGTFGTAPTGWALTSGTAPSAGMTLWQAKVALTDSAANSTTAFNWTAAGISAIGYAGGVGASYVTAYCASSTPTATSAPAATTGKASLPAKDSGGIIGTWTPTVPTLTVGQFMYQSDGIYDPATDKVTWSIPYWSSLKVGSLSAITANLGQITAGDININGGIAHIDSTGAATFKSISIQDANGNTILSSGGQLAPSAAAPGTLNSDLVPAISAAATAALNAASLYPPVSDPSWTGGTVVDINETVNGVAVVSKSLRSTGGTSEPVGTRVFPIDRTRTYRTRFWARAGAGTNGVLYHALRQYLANGNPHGTNGGYLWYQPVNIAAHTDWREYDFTWAGTSFDATCASVRPSLLMNYSGTTGYWEIRDYLMQDVTDVTRAATTATWTGVSGANKPQDNATVGATIGLNLAGQLTKANMSTYIASAAIDLAYIDKASITSLSALSANIGFLTNRTNGTGAGMERISDSDKVYDTNSNIRVVMGKLN